MYWSIELLIQLKAVTLSSVTCGLLCSLCFHQRLSWAKTPLCFVPGETIQTKLHGDAIHLNVGLSAYSVELEKTYITVLCHTTTVIENRSDTTAHFQWRTYPNEEEENQKKRRWVWKMHFSEICGPRLKLTYGLRGLLVLLNGLGQVNHLWN